ncbi:hypothetical protein QAD02_001056 [Eretmocerus hayati]|uniref:Uncharacterized protein n=1 Tax=Eretmocerus hayati TaxID=131215 RepID=A0ACC2NF53_9HYME|nr:hypothetical protein QAD02_001056 [Eretmocerus hayati]
MLTTIDIRMFGQTKTMNIDIYTSYGFAFHLLWLWILVKPSHMWCTATEELMIETPLGVYFGHYKVSINGKKYAAFEGIPYAQPPVGSLRFEDPVPITNSFGQLNVTKKSLVCMQYRERPPLKNDLPPTENSIKGSEDCLFLDVYMPLLGNTEKRMPALVDIHGGAFQHGSSSFLDDRYFVDRNLIFITINYRLGILGFLSTEDKVVPGNMGLKDQNLALKWISRNIQYFRGDTNRITIMGFSAGSSSVQYHHLSPWSRGLFNSSIGISGTVFNPWAFAKGVRQKTEQLAILFDCSTDNSQEMIDCLKKVPTRELVGAHKQFRTWQNNPEAPWAPVVDKHSSNPFIPQSPQDIFKSGSIHDVPMVFGVVKDEGCDPFAGYAEHEDLLKQLDENWISIAPGLLEYNYTIPSSMYDKVAIDSRREYFGDSSIDNKTKAQLQQLITDQRYFIAIEYGVRLHAAASKSPVHMYFYSFRSSESRSDKLSGTRKSYGVCHGDDLDLVSQRRMNTKSPKTQEDREMTEFLLDMWTSVVHHGVPRINVDWKAVNASDLEFKYLKIAAPGNYSMSGSSNFGRKSYWRKYFFTDSI